VISLAYFQTFPKSLKNPWRG